MKLGIILTIIVSAMLLAGAVIVEGISEYLGAFGTAHKVLYTAWGVVAMQCLMCFSERLKRRDSFDQFLEKLKRKYKSE